MAAGDVTFGSKTALANIDRLNGNTDGVAEAFGELGPITALDYDIHIIVPVHASATGGSYTLYMVESMDGAEWTDNIDPASSGDVADKIADAKVLKVSGTVYDASHRTEVEFYVKAAQLGGGFTSAYIGFVLLNDSGQPIPGSGADGDSMTIKIAAS